jgi:hypothetical protein
MSFEGDAKNILNSLKELKKTEDFITATLDEMAARFLEILQTYIKQQAFDKGDYLRSWHIKKSSPNSRTIKSDENMMFAILEITGAREHKIEARYANFLHWVDDSGIHHFAKWVIHPFQPPQPHFRPAVKDFEQIAPKIINNNIQKFFKVFK